jgi:DNA-binding CsgD family transcriptional regulator
VRAFYHWIQVNKQNNRLSEALKTSLNDLGLSHFIIQGVSNTGQFFMQSNEAQLIEDYCQKHLWRECPVFHHQDHIHQAAVSIWDHSTSQDRAATKMQNWWLSHGITSGVSIVRKSENGHELYFFGKSSQCSQHSQYWLHHLPRLLQFIEAWRSEHASWIELSKVETIDLLHVIGNDYSNSQKKPSLFQHAIHPVITENKKIKHKIKEELTEKEHTITLMTIQGLTAKEVAEQLNLSRRTIENTLARIKDKLNCKNQKELIAKFI